MAPGIAVARAHPVRHRSILRPLSVSDTARGAAFSPSPYPVEVTPKTMLLDVSSFKRVSRVYGSGSQRYVSRAKFFQWLATYALRLLRIF